MSIALPTLPSHWGWNRVDRVASVNARIGWKALTAAEYQPDGVRFLSTPNIKGSEIDFRNVNYISEFRYEESPELKLQEGDVLLAKDGNTLGIVNMVKQLPGPATVNGSIAVIRPTQVSSSFLRYVLESRLTQAAISMLKGGMGVPHLFQWDINRLPVPLPPLEDQRRIADFLDVEIARIDQLVSKLAEMTELVTLRGKALIRERLQGGRTASAVAPTNVPWLSAMPEHWDAAPLRYISRIQRGASPRPIDDPVYFDEMGTHAWVRISDVTASDKYLVETTQRLSALGVSLSVPLRPGELFVSIAGSVGKPIITQIPCCIHDGFVAITNPLVNTDFLYYVLLLGDAFRGLGKLGTQLNLNSETVGSIKIPIPPEHEQAVIVSQLDADMMATTRLSRSLRRQTALLAERRQALITAAVTGQFDVSAASGRNVTEGITA
ncbi:restriction endonuclease subunit S [Streptomyces sp. NPDC059072]|uniref:restriction endonuclease subunit S n=1 Tax=Streptomyces sp. NPDC059072 TaxID=3346715 RepID=UPI00369800AD